MTTSVVYVDGACTENGQDNAQAAIGVFRNDNDEKNISEVLYLQINPKLMGMLNCQL